MSLPFTNALASIVFAVLSTHIYNLTNAPQHFTPERIVLGADGTIWMSEGDQRIAHAMGGKILRIYSAPPGGSQIQSMARDSKGNIWFTETQTYDGSRNFIGRMTPSGAFTIYPVKRANAFVMGLAIARDGSIWFTEYGQHRIGRLSGDRKITEFLLPRAASPQSIVLGSDGNLWTTGADSAVRISPSGVMTSFTLPVRGQLRTISNSSGQALWVTAYKTTALIRVMPSGAARVVRYPHHRWGILRLYPGPRNTAIGFNLDTAGIVAFSDDGSVTPIYTPSGLNNYAGDDIVYSPSGLLWFTISAKNAYGCLRLPPNTSR